LRLDIKVGSVTKFCNVGRFTKKRGGNTNNSSRGLKEVTIVYTIGNIAKAPAKNKNRKKNIFPHLLRE
jgi:hypothetical protein